MRVLVIDDHEALRDLLSRALTRDGHTVRTASTLHEADEILRVDIPDLIVLDLQLPDGWGITWCRTLRERGHASLVLVLSAHADITRKVQGFEAGADDVLAKPFAVAELRARVQALGRRVGTQRNFVVKHGDTEVQVAGRVAQRNGETIPLTAREWAVLEVLIRARGNVVLRSALLDEVWGQDDEATSSSLEVLIGRIRRKLGSQWIRTQRGDGYALGV